MSRKNSPTHRNFACPTQGCRALLKVPVDAQPGVYLCKCEASAVRYRIENRKQAVGNGLTTERWLERAPTPVLPASAGKREE